MKGHPISSVAQDGWDGFSSEGQDSIPSARGGALWVGDCPAASGDSSARSPDDQKDPRGKRFHYFLLLSPARMSSLYKPGFVWPRPACLHDLAQYPRKAHRLSVLEGNVKGKEARPGSCRLLSFAVGSQGALLLCPCQVHASLPCPLVPDQSAEQYRLRGSTVHKGLPLLLRRDCVFWFGKQEI